VDEDRYHSPAHRGNGLPSSSLCAARREPRPAPLAPRRQPERKVPIRLANGPARRRRRYVTTDKEKLMNPEHACIHLVIHPPSRPGWCGQPGGTGRARHEARSAAARTQTHARGGVHGRAPWRGRGPAPASTVTYVWRSKLHADGARHGEEPTHCTALDRCSPQSRLPRHRPQRLRVHSTPQPGAGW
jgi:hypothetical protein